jgi:transcriptional regulator with XRE-family HTH domain
MTTTSTTTSNRRPAAVTGPSRTKRDGVAAAICAHVGNRLRAARNLAGISQAAAGELIGVSFQQIQKYEKGMNRVSVGTLAVFADAFDLPITWFFDGAPGVEEKPKARKPDVAGQLLATPYGPDLARDYLAIKANQDRSVVAQVAHALAAKGGAA